MRVSEPSEEECDGNLRESKEICLRALYHQGALAAALLSTGLFRGQTLDPFKNFPSIGGRVKRRAAFADKNKNRN
jgi:hypothetical protein